MKYDFTDFLKLNHKEQHFIKHILAFFATADGIVNENLAQNFMHEVTAPEARAFYAFQSMIESVHAEMYALLLDTLVTKKNEKVQLFRAMFNVESIKLKADWALKWCQSDKPFAMRLIAFAIVEGIFFSGAFCAIFWLKHHHPGLMPGLTFSNELISRDEALHCQFACEINKLLLKPATPNQIMSMVTEAVNIEQVFTNEALPTPLLGMNAQTMGQYIKFCADRLLVDLGQPKHYKVENPYPWMTLISLQGKTNFFEKQVGEYAKSGVASKHHHEFDLSADF